jgi:hypothetical protein
MGKGRKFNQPVYTQAEADVAQSITLSGASGTYTTATINGYGTTIIGSTGTGAGWSVKLAAPARKYIRKTIIVDVNSTAPVSIYTSSTATTVGGSTSNVITFTTGTTGAAQPESCVQLFAKTTSHWSILNREPSTAAVTLAASTSPF